jgi:hypothetical protein
MRAFRRWPSFAAAIVCTALSACAAPQTQPVGNDWKLGHVRKVVLGSAIKDVDVRPCVARLPSDAIGAQEFVVVTYPKGRTWGYRTVEFPTAFVPEPGEEVWVNIRDCSAQLRKASQAGSAPGAYSGDNMD